MQEAERDMYQKELESIENDIKTFQNKQLKQADLEQELDALMKEEAALDEELSSLEEVEQKQEAMLAEKESKK